MIIGLTGASGSGKSTVAAFFEELGFLIVDFDEITHNIYKDSIDCINEIRYNFEGVVTENIIDRKKLAEIVFSDKEKLEILNKTVHKYIMKRLDEILKSNNDKNIILDAPLLFEANLDKKCDYTICVTCDFDKKVKRIMSRDNLTYKAALARLKNQKDDAYFISKCDFYINSNNGVKISDVEAVLNNISGGARKNQCQN